MQKMPYTNSYDFPLSDSRLIMVEEPSLGATGELCRSLEALVPPFANAEVADPR